MKKILIVIPGCRTGGMVSSLVALLNSQFSRRYDIRLFVMNSYGEKLRPELEIYSVGMNKGTSFLYANVVNYTKFLRWKLVAFKLIIHIPIVGRAIHDWIEGTTISKLERHNYDYIVSFQESVSLPFVAKFANENKVAWIHCDYSRIFTNVKDELSIFSRYSRIVTVSEYTKNVFCRLLPSLEPRVEFIYNMLDYESIVDKSRDYIDDSRFITDRYTIISVGRISSVKQFEVIPKIAAEIKSKGGHFRWYIIGGKYERNAYDKLAKSIVEFSVEGEVICLGNKSNPYPYFRVADLLVSTSYSEACPMIFNEAKILNTPIVTNNFGSSYEFVSEGVDGYIRPIMEMADTIYGIISSKTVFHPTITTNFDEQSILEKVDNLFE